MEVSALKYQGGSGVALHGRSPLLRLQSDERLITAIRRGNTAAFEVLLSRYQSRLLSFCRHMLGSREDAEDVLQEVMAAAFNAIVADERPIQVRPWLYRIARNRSLNHLRKRTAIGVDTMDTQLAENGATTADKVGEREEFRMLVGDIQDLPETQRTALVLREMDALSYDQIAAAMETTVSSVKSLLVRARVSLAEAADARLLSCEEVRMQLAEVAEGLQRRPSPLVRRHLKDCKRCSDFKVQLKANNKALAALLPVGPFVLARKFAFLHLGHSAGAAGAGTGATAAGGTAATAAGGLSGALAGSGVFSGGSLVSAGLSAVATKAAAGLAAAAVVTAGAVAVDHHHVTPQPAAVVPSASAVEPSSTDQVAPGQSYIEQPSTVAQQARHISRAAAGAHAQTTTLSVTTSTGTAIPVAATPPATTDTTATATTPITTVPAPGRVQTQTDPTVLPPTATTPAPPIGIPISSTPTTTTVVATLPTTVSTAPVATSPTAPISTAPTTPVASPPTAPVPVTTTPVIVATPTQPAPTSPLPTSSTPTGSTPTPPAPTTPTTPPPTSSTPVPTTPTVTTIVTAPTVSIPVPSAP
jgi:RNA polymerase sigma factor (sigma-70 family)